MKHILICGARGVGKSTLIAKLIAKVDAPLYGYFTKRLDKADDDGLFPIYLYPAWVKDEERERGVENMIGRCSGKMHDVHAEVFDKFGAKYIRAAKPGGVIIMDELGFMERNAEEFKSAVFSALDGDIQVIAAVKDRYDVEFLNAVRAHEKAQVFNITEQNRDSLYGEILPLIAKI